jgi:hypothetical protein
MVIMGNVCVVDVLECLHVPTFAPRQEQGQRGEGVSVQGLGQVETLLQTIASDGLDMSHVYVSICVLYAW